MSKFWGSIATEDQLEVSKLVLGEEQQQQEPTMLDVEQSVDEKVLLARQPEPEEDPLETGEDSPPEDTEPTDPEEAPPPEEGEEEPTEDDSEDNEDDVEPSIDEGKDDAKEPEGEKVTDSDPDGESIATESFRASYPFKHKSLATEATFAEHMFEGSTPAFQAGVNFTAGAIKSLAVIGIPFAGKVAKRFYKGVIYTFGKLSSGLASSIYLLDKTVERKQKSLPALETKIAKAIESLDKLVEAGVTELSEDAVYDNVKVINKLKIGETKDFTASSKVLLDFMGKSIATLSKGISYDLSRVKYAIEASKRADIGDPLKLLHVELKHGGLFKEGSMEGFKTGSDKLTSYYSLVKLPGDVRMIAHLPRKDLETISDYASAYNQSSIFLGADTQSFRLAEQVDYMGVAELRSFLLSLQALCYASKGQVDFYTDLRKIKLDSRLTYKGYFESLASRKSKTRLRDSMVEIVYLRNLMTDKVYLPAAIDMHYYVADYIDAGLSFAKKNILALG